MAKYFKTPLTSDLSNTSYRCRKDAEESICIEYNEGFVGEDWIELSEQEVKTIAPEWFEEPVKPLTESEERQIDILLNTEYIACLLESQLA